MDMYKVSSMDYLVVHCSSSSYNRTEAKLAKLLPNKYSKWQDADPE